MLCECESSKKKTPSRLYSRNCRNEKSCLYDSLSLYLSCYPAIQHPLSSSLTLSHPSHPLFTSSPPMACIITHFMLPTNHQSVMCKSSRCHPMGPGERCSCAGKLDASQKVLCLSIRPPCGRQPRPAALVTVMCLSSGPFIHSHYPLAQKRCFRSLRPPELGPELAPSPPAVLLDKLLGARVGS